MNRGMRRKDPRDHELFRTLKAKKCEKKNYKISPLYVGKVDPISTPTAPPRRRPVDGYRCNKVHHYRLFEIIIEYHI